MGFFETIRANFSRSSPKSLSESGIGFVAKRTSFGFMPQGKSDSEPQNIPLQQKYNNAYLNFPVVAAAIDITAEQVVQTIEFNGKDKNEIERWSDKVNFRYHLLTIVKHMLKNGNCWIELPDKKSLKVLAPEEIRTYRKKTGDIIGHAQEIDGKMVALWGTTGDPEKDKVIPAGKRRPLKEIVHFKFNTLGSDKYGTSLIHPVLPLLNFKDAIESDLKTIVRRYAAPIIHAKVGDADHIPSDTDLTSIRSSLEDIYADTEYVTNHLTTMEVLGFQGEALNIEYILKHIDMNIVAGLQVPAELIGMSSSNKAEAEVKLRSFGRHVKSIQRILKVEVEDKVIQGFLGLPATNKVEFGHAEEREAEIFIDQVRGLVKDGIITPQKGNDLLPEKFREKLPENTNMLMPNGMPQDRTPFNKGADAVKDNPNDPTQSQDKKDLNKRRNKTDKQIPIK